MTPPERPLDCALERVSNSEAVQHNEVYPLAGVYSFGRGVIRRDPIDGADTKYTHMTKLCSGQLVMSKLNAWEGALAVVPDEFAGSYVSSEYPVFSIDRSVASPAYLKYLANWPRLWEKLTPRGSMVRRKRTKPEVLLQARVPLPDIDEQRRITSKLDSAMERHTHIGSLAPDLSREKLSSLLASGTEKILQRWKSDSIRIRDACEMVNDTVHPGDDPGDAVEFIGLEHIASNLGVCVGSRPVGGEKGRKFRFTSNDVLYGYLRPYLNKVWSADRPGLCSVEQYVLRPNDWILSGILAHCLRGKGVVDAVDELTNKLQLPRLRSKLLLNLEIPYVAPSEQQYALEQLDDFVNQVSRYVRLNAERKDAVKALHSSLLNAAFSGRL